MGTSKFEERWACVSAVAIVIVLRKPSVMVLGALQSSANISLLFFYPNAICIIYFVEYVLFLPVLCPVIMLAVLEFTVFFLTIF